MYAYKHDYNSSYENALGTDSKEAGYKGHFIKFELDGASVVDFACSRTASCVIMEGAKPPQGSIIPEKPEETGLIHFYKSGDEWKFITEDEY